MNVEPLDASNILLSIFYLVPGFLSYKIIRYIGVIEKTETAIEIFYWSLLLSMVNLSVVLLVSNVTKSLGLRFSVLMVNNPFTYVLLLAFSGILGVVLGLIFRRVFKGEHILRGDAWKNIIKEKEKEAYRGKERKPQKVIIKLTDGELIKGILYHAGVSPDPRDIVLQNPIFSDKKQFKGVLFIPENMIKEVLFEEARNDKDSI